MAQFTKKPDMFKCIKNNGRNEHICPETILKGMSTLPNASEISGLLLVQVGQISDLVLPY